MKHDYRFIYKFVGTKEQIDDLQKKVESSKTLRDLYESVVEYNFDVENAPISDIKRVDDEVLTFVIYEEDADPRDPVWNIEKDIRRIPEHYPGIAYGFVCSDSNGIRKYRNYDDGSPCAILDGKEYSNYASFFDDMKKKLPHKETMLEIEDIYVQVKDGSELVYFMGKEPNNTSPYYEPLSTCDKKYEADKKNWAKLNMNNVDPLFFVQDNVVYEYSRELGGWVARDYNSPDDISTLSLHIPTTLENGGAVVGVRFDNEENGYNHYYKHEKLDLLEIWLPKSCIYIHCLPYCEKLHLHMEHTCPPRTRFIWQELEGEYPVDMGSSTKSDWSEKVDYNSTECAWEPKWQFVEACGIVCLDTEFDPDNECDADYSDLDCTIYVPRGAKSNYECDDRFENLDITIEEEDYDWASVTKTEPKEEAPAAKVEEAPAAAPKEEPAISNIYVGKNGTEQKGPYSVEQIQALKDFGAIDESSLIWYQGLAAWTELGKIDELK